MVRLNHLARALTLFGFAASLYAVDGIVLIDQNRALAGGVTPGDTPGFPITISQPGSYRLASNLTLDTGDVIVITSSDVTLDFNGFSVTVANASFPTRVVSSLAVGRIRIMNGSISGKGFSWNAIYLPLAKLVTIQNMVIDAAGAGAMLVGAGFAGDTNFILNGNITTGFVQVSCPGIIMNSTNDQGIVRENAGLCLMTNNINPF